MQKRVGKKRIKRLKPIRLPMKCDNYKILIVDDDEDILFLLGAMLIEMGYRIVSADSEKQLFELLVMEKPDLIILDYLLGGRNGLEILREIRETSDIPVIIYTGYDVAAIRQRLFRATVVPKRSDPQSQRRLLVIIAIALRTRFNLALITRQELRKIKQIQQEEIGF